METNETQTQGASVMTKTNKTLDKVNEVNDYFKTQSMYKRSHLQRSLDGLIGELQEMSEGMKNGKFPRDDSWQYKARDITNIGVECTRLSANLEMLQSITNEVNENDN